MCLNDSARYYTNITLLGQGLVFLHVNLPLIAEFGKFRIFWDPVRQVVLRKHR